jgi:hypothetical protein
LFWKESSPPSELIGVVEKNTGIPPAGRSGAHDKKSDTGAGPG